VKKETERHNEVSKMFLSKAQKSEENDNIVTNLLKAGAHYLAIAQ
jgi:hypothetical protein